MKVWQLGSWTVRVYYTWKRIGCEIEAPYFHFYVFSDAKK